MKIRDLLLILLHISLEGVYGKSFRHVHKDSSVELTSKHHIDESKSERHSIVRRSNEKLSKHKIEKHKEGIVTPFHNSNGADKSVPGDSNDDVETVHINKVLHGDEAAGGNGGVVFENAGDDGINLMEEEKEEEEEEEDNAPNASQFVSPKAEERSQKESKASEQEGSGDDSLVEPDMHSGTENSQHNAGQGKNNNHKSISSGSRTVNASAKENSALKSKDKQVVLMPQSSVQEGTKSQVSNISDVAKYPSLPIPQMIPLPLFYNSGESEGSATHLASNTKNTKEVDDFNGESGFGELPLTNSQTYHEKKLELTVQNQAGKSIKSLKSFGEKVAQVKEEKVPKEGAQITKHHGAGKKMAEVMNTKPLHAQLHKKFSHHKSAGDLNAHISATTKSDEADMQQLCADNSTHDAATYKRNCYSEWLDKGEPSATRADINDGETTTDYPFVVSGGPKANIHPIVNSKIKIGNDHDEDLVDYYDDDEGGDEVKNAAPMKQENSNEALTSGEPDHKAGFGKEEEASGEPSSIPIQVLGRDGISDLKDNEEKVEDQDDEPEEKMETAELSGSGSGEITPDYSGDSDNQPYIQNSGMATGANQGGPGAMPSDADMGAGWMKGQQSDQTQPINSYALEQLNNSATGAALVAAAAAGNFSQTYMLPITEKQCEALQLYASTNPQDASAWLQGAEQNSLQRSAESAQPNNTQQVMTNGDYLLSKTKPGDAKTLQQMIIKLAQDCYNAKIKEVDDKHPLVDGTLPKEKKKSSKAKARQYKILTMPGEAQQLINLPNIRKLNETFASSGNTMQFLPVIGPIHDDSAKPDISSTKRKNIKSNSEDENGEDLNDSENEEDFMENDKEDDDNNGEVPTGGEKPFIEIEFPDYSKMDLNALKRGGSANSGNAGKQKKLKKLKIKTKAFEFGKGELGDNDGPVVVPAAQKPLKDGKPVNAKPNAKLMKEQWIVNNVKVNKDIKSILSDFSGVQPSYTATAGAPQALPVPQQMYQAQPVQPVNRAAQPNPAQQANPAQQQALAYQAQVQAYQAQQQRAQMERAKTMPNDAANFLKQGVGARIMNALSTRPDAVAQSVAAAVPAQQQQQQRQQTYQQAYQQDPNCCRSNLSPEKKVEDGGTLTAEILPIPEHLNKALEDAGIGPGATAQILPTAENMKILKDAGYGAGVTAQVVPIPADLQVVGGSLNVDARSGGKSPQILASFPQLTKLFAGNQQKSEAPAQAQAPAAPSAPAPAQVAAGYQAQSSQQNGYTQQQQAAMYPNQQQAMQQQLPRQQQQTAAYKDPTYLDIISRSDSPVKPGEQTQQQPIAAAKPADISPKVVNLPAGQKNYDDESYKQILAELPPSVAPDQPIASLASPQQLPQLSINDMGNRPINLFFQSPKTHDPLQNLDAYKRQQFKHFDLDEDRR